MATARFMETWAHSLDVHEALGVEPEVTDRIRHIAHLGRPHPRLRLRRARARRAPTEEFRIALTAPSGDLWAWGPEDAAQTVTGSAYDFCLLVTQRVNRADTVAGRGRSRRRHVAVHRAGFAGPPGEGREPR